MNLTREESAALSAPLSCGIRYAAAALLAAAAACGRGGSPPDDDPRTALALPVEAAAGIRAEMRTMLASVHTILDALPRHDTNAIRAAARASGMTAAADTALEALLPEQFLSLGVATHRAFDSLASAPGPALSTDSVVARLGRITANCVTCHGQYRVAVR